MRIRGVPMPGRHRQATLGYVTDELRGDTSALALAALASAAAPSLQLREIRGPVLSADSGDWAHLADASGSQWLVWAPTQPLSGDAMERYLKVVDYLEAERSAGEVTWVAPRPLGEAVSEAYVQVLLLPYPGGRPLEAADLSGAGLLPSSLGTALAALHGLETRAYAACCRRFADAALTRKALRSLVDRHSSAIPSRLRSRWLDAIEEDPLWRFEPVPLHGSLSAECVYASDGAVVGLTRFDQAAVGDPAQDIVWLMYYASDDFLGAFEEAYSRSCSTPDLHLLTRAQLLSELETLRWYARGVEADSREWRDQGVQALRDLDRDIGDHRLVPARPNVVEISFTVEEEPLLKLNPQNAPKRPEVADVTPPDPAAAERPTDVLAVDEVTGLYTPFPPSAPEPDSEPFQGEPDSEPFRSGVDPLQAQADQAPQRPIRRGNAKSVTPALGEDAGTGSVEVP